jgi:hypothetical protein
MFVTSAKKFQGMSAANKYRAKTCKPEGLPKGAPALNITPKTKV